MNISYLPSLQKHPRFNPLLWLLILAVIFILIGRCRADNLVDMDIIKQIESNGNPNAVSSEGAIGLYQIMYVVLEEYNVMTETHYTSRDLFNPVINEQIANWYMNFRIPQMLRHFKKPITLENCLISYNAGIGCVLSGKIPEETQNYITKYKELTRLK